MADELDFIIKGICVQSIKDNTSDIIVHMGDMHNVPNKSMIIVELVPSNEENNILDEKRIRNQVKF